MARPGRLGLVKNALDAGPGKNRNYSYLTYHMVRDVDIA
jgi:hypothetical protein